MVHKMSKGFYIGFKGRLEAYIYIWFSKKEKLVYVGQTNNYHGVIGRALQHIEPESGTLYNRVEDYGYELTNIEDFVLLSYPLPREKAYLSSDTSYRISVEYLVQKGLIASRIRSKTPYRLISNVTPGQYINLKSVQNISEEIIDDFMEIYEDL